MGSGLHNGTEGFGIVAPLAGDAQRPSWRFLGALGLIGGGPTFLGTLVGQAWTSTGLSVAFLALAAGSILYVIVQLVNVNVRLGHKTLVARGMFGRRGPGAAGRPPRAPGRGGGPRRRGARRGARAPPPRPGAAGGGPGPAAAARPPAPTGCRGSSLPSPRRTSRRAARRRAAKDVRR